MALINKLMQKEASLEDNDLTHDIISRDLFLLTIFFQLNSSPLLLLFLFLSLHHPLSVLIQCIQNRRTHTLNLVCVYILALFMNRVYRLVKHLFHHPQH